MLHLDAGAGALDYSPCRYGASRALFRGPARDLTRPYVAVLGGSESFGKYVAQPWPALVEAGLGQTVVNLAAQNAGPDFYLSDPAALEVAARARVAVVQVTGAEALSNPFYTVHARRNDRFLAPTSALRALFPEVDLAEIHFTRHLLSVLHRADPVRCSVVIEALRRTWVDRMRLLLARLPERRLLLWLTELALPSRAVWPDRAPVSIDRAMVEALAGEVSGIVDLVPSPQARTMARLDMIYPETEAAQAACLPGAAVHAEVAARLVPRVAELM
ncbi:MAG: DUF6473 family protein [Tabrizicola flagellatus]|uniref:DUF6473 family protein n=1 Tax=Tabrizicola flagellatus TaxID=2593021 RepID=UPI00391CDFE6